jgi:RNA polymerase sigma-70 factor (ECF subfamily)
MDDDSDEALMARVARGDERAFQLLSRRHLPAMLGLARRVLGNAAEAEDVAQEAFMRVWTHAPRWQPLAQFRTWLTRIVINLCLDRKRRVAWVELERAGEIVDQSPGVGDKAEDAERERMLAAAIEKLPARQRSAIALTQVAEILDTSVSAVETLLVRAKQNLRRALASVIDKDD